jgi:hypothetical protein
MNCDGWVAGDGKSWGMDGRSSWLKDERRVGWALWRGDRERDKYEGGKMGWFWDNTRRTTVIGLQSPSVKVHETVVKAIREQLHEFMDYATLKFKELQSATISF